MKNIAYVVIMKQGWCIKGNRHGVVVLWEHRRRRKLRKERQYVVRQEQGMHTVTTGIVIVVRITVNGIYQEGDMTVVYGRCV